jgi:hypothetical protein
VAEEGSTGLRRCRRASRSGLNIRPRSATPSAQSEVNGRTGDHAIALPGAAEGASGV